MKLLKKTVSILLAFITVFSVLTIIPFNAFAAVFSATAESNYIRGDADGDGKVTITDVTLIQRVIAQLEPDSNGTVIRCGNVTEGSFGVTDATAIQRYLSGFDNPYKIGETVSYDEYELPFVPN